MTREEFDSALTTAALGIAKPLTDAQADALWSRYREEQLPTWRYALESIQQAGRWPTPNGWKAQIEQARREMSLGVGAPGQRRRLCSCGGQLGATQRSGLPAGFVYPLIELPSSVKATADGLARHQAENPEAWSFGILRECSSCHAAYFQAGEDASINDARGRRRVLVGELRQLSPKQIGQLGGSADAPETLRPVDHDYGSARLKILRDILAKRLRPEDLPDRLLQLADDFPDHAPALVRDAEEAAQRAGQAARPGNDLDLPRPVSPPPGKVDPGASQGPSAP